MEINKVKTGSSLEYKLTGRLDTNTAPKLSEDVSVSISAEVINVVLDFSELEYISSAGLRVVLLVQKKMMSQKGDMVIRHPNQMVSEVFDATGFSDIMKIEL